MKTITYRQSHGLVAVPHAVWLCPAEEAAGILLEFGLTDDLVNRAIYCRKKEGLPVVAADFEGWLSEHVKPTGQKLPQPKQAVTEPPPYRPGCGTCGGGSVVGPSKR